MANQYKPGHYILENRLPIREPNLKRWAEWMGTANRRVSRTMIGEVTISTVFLGLDCSFAFGPPGLFETMIFGGKYNRYYARYGCWEEAERGHFQAMCMVSESRI